MPEIKPYRQNFFGVTYCNIDAQRRLLLPKNWRSPDESSRYYIVPALPNFIKVFDQYHFDKFLDLLERLDEEDPSIRDGMAITGSLSADFVPDKLGRFMLSPEIIAFGNLNKQVAFIGAVTYGLIIPRELWEKCGQDFEKLQRFQDSVSAERRKLATGK